MQLQLQALHWGVGLGCGWSWIRVPPGLGFGVSGPGVSHQWKDILRSCGVSVGLEMEQALV